MSKIYFTSDQHFYHKNVIKYSRRPFRTKNPFIRLKEWWTGDISVQSTEVMKEELIRRHNEVVKPGDIVYHLGDFSLWKHAPEHVLHRLNGEHHLIAGNHDWCHKVTAKNKVEKMVALYKKAGFKTIAYEGEIELGGIKFKMHHMPYFVKHADQRYKDYRPNDEGGWLLHGHIHEHWKVRDKMINVGVDVWNYYPVSVDQILELVENG